MGATLTRRDNRMIAKIQDGEPASGGDGAGALAHSDPSIKAQEAKPVVVAKPEPAAVDEPPFRVPPLTAIAGVLISEWAHGKIQPGAGEVKRGNL